MGHESLPRATWLHDARTRRPLEGETTTTVEYVTGLCERRRVAVVGSGVAGLTAAHALRSAGCNVTLYEADHRLGGHADTHLVDVGGRTVAADTGFIVHNDRTYPTLLRLFAELGVQTRDSDMSMSIRFDSTRHEPGVEYAGALGARGLFPSARNLLNFSYFLPRPPRRA